MDTVESCSIKRYNADRANKPSVKDHFHPLPSSAIWTTPFLQDPPRFVVVWNAHDVVGHSHVHNANIELRTDPVTGARFCFDRCDNGILFSFSTVQACEVGVEIAVRHETLTFEQMVLLLEIAVFRCNREFES